MVLAKQEVIKHSASIHVSNEVNLLQRQAWNVLLANAYDDLPTQNEFQVRVRDLCEVLGYESNNSKHLKGLLRALVHTAVEWNILEKDETRWGTAALLAEVEIINGMLFYSYPVRFKKRLHNPAMYARINLSLQNQFDSKHSLALYELCVDYFDPRRGQGRTPKMSIEKFRRLLGLQENEYKQFKALSRDVIRKALKEINAKSDLLVEEKYQRQGRRVATVQLYIKRNPNNAIPIRALEKRFQEDQLLLPGLTSQEEEIDNLELFKVLTEEFVVGSKKAAEIVKTRDESYIEENLEAVRKKMKSGGVRNIAAFTVKAIEDDYRHKKTKAELKKGDEARQRAEALREAQRKEDLLEKLKAEFTNQQKAAVEPLLEASADQRQEVLAGFERDRIQGSIFGKYYEKDGLNDRLIKPMFYDYAVMQFKDQLEPELQDLRQFAAQRGHKVVGVYENDKLLRYELDE